MSIDSERVNSVFVAFNRTPKDGPPPELTRADARGLALRRLGFREHSMRELSDWLQKKGVSREDAVSVVEELAALDFVNDARYARMLVREQTLRGKGPAVIRQRLKQKGIALDPDLLKELAFEASGQSALEQAVAIVERRYPRYRDDKREAQRAYGALIRRGFSFDVARDALLGRSGKTR